MSARVEDGTPWQGRRDAIERAVRSAVRKPRPPARASISSAPRSPSTSRASLPTTAAERITGGAASADGCLWRGLRCSSRSFDETAGAFAKVYAGRSTFSACNPERAARAGCSTSSRGSRSRLEHLRLLEIKDTANPSLLSMHDAQRLAGLNVGAVARRRLQHSRPTWRSARRLERGAESRNGPPSCSSR